MYFWVLWCFGWVCFVLLYVEVSELGVGLVLVGGLFYFLVFLVGDLCYL